MNMRPLIAVLGLGLTCGLAPLHGWGQTRNIAGDVKIDGSSTVAPCIMVASELFNEQHPRVRVSVGVSGTGGGFKKFLDAKPELRTDISNASRPISSEEAGKAAELGIQFIELPISLEGLSVVVHPGNKFCDHLTLAELKKIWEPSSTVKNWKDVRAGFPDLPLKLYGAGTDSGTFDYFTEAVVGKAKSSRSDYNASEDDNVLVQGVAGDPGALGYFGYSYYEANKDRLKVLGIAKHGQPVKPTSETVRNGTYPLARPLLIYVNRQSADRPEVDAFVTFVLTNARKIVEHPKVADVALGDDLYAAMRQRLQKRTTGTVFKGKTQTQSLAELYAAKQD